MGHRSMEQPSKISQSKRGSTITESSLNTPQSNTAECFMKNMGKTLRIAHHKGEKPKSAINNHLKSYCATTYPATGETPAALLFQGRQFCTKLPQLSIDYDEGLAVKIDTTGTTQQKVSKAI